MPRCYSGRYSGSLLFAFLSLAVSASQETSKKVKVFGLGPGRSGTESLGMAFKRLGFGPSYHTKEIFLEIYGLPTHDDIRRWHKAAQGVETHNNLAAILEPWGSGTDWPLAAFGEELLQIYPDAKFVLSIRPAEKWYASMSSTICNIGYRSWYFPVLWQLPIFPFNRFKSQIETADAVIEKVFDGHDFVYMCDPANREVTLKWYDEWNLRIQKMIPKKQLLVFQTGEHGYKELAPFLNVPVPDEPYPSTNSGKEIKFLLSLLRNIAIVMILVLTLFIVLLVKKLHIVFSTSEKAKSL